MLTSVLGKWIYSQNKISLTYRSMCWPCCTYDIVAQWAVPIYKILKYMFYYKLYNSWPIVKIFTGVTEQAIRYLHIHFLSNLIFLNVHINYYKIKDIQEFYNNYIDYTLLL